MARGHIIEIGNYHKGQKELITTMSVPMLSSFFGRNHVELKRINRTITQQLRDLHDMYGIKVSANVFADLKNGRRYKTGWLLIMAIKDYWLKQGVHIYIEELL